MANYNPATGQWEEEDEESSLTGGATAAFGVGSSPAVDGSAMTGPPPLLELPGGWKESYSGFTPDRENRVATVNNGDFLGALREASYLPTSADKYTNRFAEYFNTASQKLGQGWKDVQMISDTDNYNWQNMTAGPVYLATAANGEKYVVEVPHSPGGAMLDWQTDPRQGWTSLGLGDLGGEGNEQLGYNAGASMIPFDQFTGFGPGSAVSLDNINPKGADFGDFLKMAAPIALAAFAMPQLASLFAPEAAVAGTVGSINPALAASFESLYAPSAWAATGAGAGTLAGGLDIGAVLGETIGQGFSSAVGFEGSMVSPFSGGIGSVGGLGLEGLPGLVSDIGSWVGDAAAIGGADTGAFANIGEMINGFDPSAFTGSNFTPSLGDAFTSTLADTGASSLSNLAPEIMGPQEPFYFDDWGKGTNALGEMTNGKGFRALQDIGANTLRDLGVPRETAANLSQGAGKMYNFMTQPMGGQRPGLFQAPSPLNTLFRGVGALDSMKQNREAMDYLKKARAGIDGNANNPNRPRGDFANQQWMNGISDPMAGYQDFMMGGGRQFIDQARAQAAKGGKRGSYINSGKMNSDLASLYMKNQIDRQNMIKGGFEGNVDNTNARAAYDSAMLPMITNQNAPLFQMLGNTGMQYGLSELFSGR